MSKIEEKRVLDRFDRKSGVVLACNPEEGLTQQSFKDECNVNIIVERYTKTGLWSSSLKPGSRVPMFGDFTAAPDFQTCMDKINQAQADFDSLPSRLRKRFNNNPAELLAFLHDPQNKDEAIALGIFAKPEAPASPAQPGITPGAEDKK